MMKWGCIKEPGLKFTGVSGSSRKHGSCIPLSDGRQGNFLEGHAGWSKYMYSSCRELVPDLHRARVLTKTYGSMVASGIVYFDWWSCLLMYDAGWMIGGRLMSTTPWWILWNIDTCESTYYVYVRDVAILTVPGGQEFLNFSSNFDQFFLKLYYFLPHFSPLGGWLPHPERPWLGWLRHWYMSGVE